MDGSLLRGIERGDRDALESLAGHYAAPVYRFLVRLCGDATLAEDLAQEVAIQLWRALPGRRFPNERALNAWVFTVATNAYRMHRRKRSADEVCWDGEIDLPASDDVNPLHHTEREDLAGRVRRAVEALPEPERRALTLKAFGDLRYQEISAATGEPVGTVKWRISRAYARLRQILLPELDGAETEEPSEGEYERLRRAAAVPGRRDEPARTVAHGASPAGLSRLFGAKGR
jgi:RNA polymerase sigma-70 factor (ECF subfamily)